MSKSLILTEVEELLRDSAVLQTELIDALIEREPLPEELAINEDSRCKYLSKRCIRKRSIKAKGELHNLCMFHRAKAIVNQRRLELKKRERSTEKGADLEVEVPTKLLSKRRSTKAIQRTTSRKRRRASSATMLLPTISVDDLPFIKCEDKQLSGYGTPSPRDIHDFNIEPFRTPATLYPEDLEALRGLVEFDKVEIMPMTWNVQL